MANIKLVIEISKEKYDVIKSDLYDTFPAEMKAWGLEAIRNGKPLAELTAEMQNMTVVRMKERKVRNMRNRYSYYVEIGKGDERK